MIKYIGSKRKLLPWIKQVVSVLDGPEGSVHRVVDLFSGTSRVARGLKGEGYHVLANDYSTYGYVLGKALVEADRNEYPPEKIEPMLRKLEQIEGYEGFITEQYCQKARFFRPKNGKRIDGIRDELENVEDETLKAILLTSLILGADKVDSTTGLQMAYLKDWAKRAHKDLSLSYPPLLPGTGKAQQGDALEVASQVDADLVYLDPPYNQHSYLGNYHIWETLCKWDDPEVYGKARKRKDCQTRKSPFNSKVKALEAMETVIDGLTGTQHLVVSFSNEGFIEQAEMVELLESWPYVITLSKAHKRYVGALIGIHNSEGEKVGKVGHTENQEFLFVATESEDAYQRLQKRARQEAFEQNAQGGLFAE